MTKGLFRKLALAAPLLLGMPLYALGADGSSSGEEMPKIFEEFSLTSATTESAPMPASSCAPAAPCAPSANCGAPASCCAPGCGCMSDNCCQTLFISGVEATMFHASSHGMSASSSVTDFLGRKFDRNDDEAFDSFTFSPRIWAGVQSDCWAILGRFWYLSDGTNGLSPFLTTNGVMSEDRIKAYTTDLEIDRIFCLGTTKVNVFLGARYAEFDAAQGIDISKLTSPTEIAFSSAFTNFAFHGIGLTTGFFGRTPITCDNCVSLIWGVRGSVLFGDDTANAQSSTSIVNNGAATAQINGANASDDVTAFIIEAQLGVQWDHQLQCLPMSAFLRLAGEYQFWDLGSGVNAIAGATSASNTGLTSARASVGNVDAQLIGLSVGAGFNW